MPRRLWVLLAAAILVATPDITAAQESTVFRGIVRDAATARPLIGAIVVLDAGRFERTTRSDETGAFTFFNVRLGEHLLNVRWVGYEEARRSVDVQANTPPIAVSLTRLQTLDTVRVRAADQAIYGVVATRDLKPIAGAEIQLVGNRAITRTDSSGRFFVEVRRPGAYIVRATADGRRPQTQSLTIDPMQGVEVAMLLDSMAGNTHALDAAYADFTARLQRRGNASVLATRAELMRDTARKTLYSATLASSPFTKAALRFGDYVCVFVDGRPRPAASVHLFDAADVEAVEFYTQKSERSATLAEAWPLGAPCSPTGERTLPGRTFYAGPTGPTARARSTRMGDDLVLWVVIWLKH